MYAKNQVPEYYRQLYGCDSCGYTSTLNWKDPLCWKCGKGTLGPCGPVLQESEYIADVSCEPTT